MYRLLASNPAVTASAFGLAAISLRRTAPAANVATAKTPWTVCSSLDSRALWGLPWAIKLFLNGLREDAPVGPRWKRLAHRKIQEVEENIRRERRLKLLLEHLLQCRCISLQVCVRRLSLSPNLRSIRRRGNQMSDSYRD